MQEMWPQTLPTMYRLDDLSKLLVKYGFEELSAVERMVLAGMPSASQWDPLLVSQVPIALEEEMQGVLDAQLPQLI